MTKWLHAVCGIPIPDGYDVSFAPVALSGDQVAQLTEDEQQSCPQTSLCGCGQIRIDV
jgi:hypothetical protein